MSITITIHGDDAKETITQLLGLSQAYHAAYTAPAPAPTAIEPVKVDENGQGVSADLPRNVDPAMPAHAIVAATPEGVEVPPAPKKSRGKKVDPAPPAAAQESAETQAQDKADEKAEVDAGRDAEKPLTRDDVKNAMTGYVKNYGMPATQEDGPPIFKEALGEPPAGEKYWKLSLVPETDQEALAKAVATWTRATKENPLKREKVA